MPKKLVVAGITGTIYDARMTKTPGLMSSDRRDRTDEAIQAVAEHMKAKAEMNKDTPPRILAVSMARCWNLDVER